MTSLAASFVAAAAAGLLLTPLARWTAWRFRALDYADGQRKLHSQPVPHLGGLALLAALAIGALAGACGHNLTEPLPLLFSALTMCTVGWLDDRRGLRVRWKLFGQMLATLPLVLAGHTINRLECCGLVIDLGWCAIPISIAWYVACANAVNFIDGADGLAATLGLVVASWVAVVADGLGHPDAAMLAVVMSGGLAGFLLHNWHPATIYLGDAGSMTVGLWLAAIAAKGSETPELGSRLVVLLSLAGLPLADVVLAIIRRMLTGKRFWLADREHIHHCLLDRGFSAPSVALMLAGVAAVGGAIAYAAAVHGRELLAWAGLSLLALATHRFGLAGCRELGLLKQTAAKWMLDILAIVSVGRNHRPSPAHLDQLPLPTAWALFLADVERHEIDELELTVAGEGSNWQHRWRGPVASSEVATSWSLDVRVGDADGKGCRLRATTRKGAATAPVELFLLSNSLRVYAEHWAKNSEALGCALRHESAASLTTLPASGDDFSKAA